MRRWHEDRNSNERSKIKAAECVIVETKGSTPRKVGAKMRVWEDGTIEGTIGGGNLEKEVIKNALNAIKNGESKLYKHDLLHQHNMCCGGTVLIYIEPIMTKKTLYIFGAGHTGAALVEYASKLDFEIFVIDNRQEYIDEIKVEGVNKMAFEHKKILASLPFDENTYVVIMTYDHAFDREILAHCIRQPHAYLGMIGSQRKIELTKKMFQEAEIATKEELEAVDMPMGLKINADGPDEIAISILAKLIEAKNGK